MHVLLETSVLFVILLHQSSTPVWVIGAGCARTVTEMYRSFGPAALQFGS